MFTNLSICWSSSSCKFLLSDPLVSLAVFPFSVFNLSTARVILAGAVLFTVEPTTFVLSAIRPDESTLSLFLIINVFSFVFSSIVPCENTSSVHLIELPLTVVGSSISPSVVTSAMNVIILKFAFIVTAICPFEVTMTFLLAFVIVSFEDSSIWP